MDCENYDYCEIANCDKQRNLTFERGAISSTKSSLFYNSVACDPVPDWSRDELSSMCPIFAGFRTDGDLE